ncbi:MAG: integrase arm-type DNA-binding domain-containing protein, partial [Xanthobacteraceae bacterium]
MPIVGKLSAVKVAREKRPGLYGDGGGLYLQVKATDNGTINKSWVFRYAIAETHENGRQKERQMGLG